MDGEHLDEDDDSYDLLSDLGESGTTGPCRDKDVPVATGSKVKGQGNITDQPKGENKPHNEKEGKGSYKSTKVKKEDVQDQQESAEVTDVVSCKIKQSEDPQQSCQGQHQENVSDLDNVEKLKGQVDKVTKDLTACQKNLEKCQRQLDKANSYNEELRKELDKLSAELHHYRSLSKRRVDVGLQVEEGDLPQIIQTGTEAGVDQDVEQSTNQQVDTEAADQPSIAEQLRSAAEEAMQQTNYVYDEQSGLYYDYSTGYYYDSERALYYDPKSGTYFYFNVDTQQYEFHSQVDLSQYAALHQTSPAQGSHQMSWDTSSYQDKGHTPMGPPEEGYKKRHGSGHTGKSEEHRKQTNRSHKKKQQKDVKRLGSDKKAFKEKRRKKEKRKEAEKWKKRRGKDRKNDEDEDRIRKGKKKDKRKEKRRRKVKKEERKEGIEKMEIEEKSIEAVHVVDSAELYGGDGSPGVVDNRECTSRSPDLYQDIDVDMTGGKEAVVLDRNDNNKSEYGDQSREQIFTDSDNAVSDSMFCNKTANKGMPPQDAKHVDSSLGFDGVDFEGNTDVLFNSNNSNMTANEITTGTDGVEADKSTGYTVTNSSVGGSSSDDLSDSDSVCTGESEIDRESDSELESGELSDSSVSSAETVSEFEEEYTEDIGVDNSEYQLDPYEENASSWPPCIRVIVSDSDCLDSGSLIIVTCNGATIGREKDMGHIILIPDPNISKVHAEITFDESQGCYMIKDVGSQNGTYLNESRISEAKKSSSLKPLSHGDTLQFGCTRLSLHIHHGTETCDGCEPGQVQAALAASRQSEPQVIQVLNKEEKIQQRRQQLNQIKKKYGLKNALYENNMAAVKNPAYSDKAELRRKTKGSDNPYVPDEAPASVARPIANSNVGHKLLKKMGWSEGESLGKDNAGIQQPIGVTMRANQKAGLGSELAGHQSLDNVHNVQKAQRLILTQKRFKEAEGKITTVKSDSQSKSLNTWVKGPTQVQDT